MYRWSAAVLGVVILTTGVRAQTDSGCAVNPVRLAVVGGVVGGTVVAIHLYQQNAWWKGHRTGFHVREDLTYAGNIDKVGHFYAASAFTFGLGKGLLWAGFDESSSIVWGAVGSTLFQTFIEVEDGYSEFWGFDRVDFASNLFGAWYPYLQHHVPVLKNVQLRFSYLPKDAGKASAIPGQTKTLFDDYEGQTLWLSVTPRSLLPESWQRYWPGFLGLALGVSVRNNADPERRHLVWYLAPELDMREIIPQETEFLKGLAEALNFFHFPLPAVRISPGVVWYGIYF